MTTNLVVTTTALPILLLALLWLMPSLVRPTLPFAVRVPARHADAPVIAEARRAYRWWIAVAGGLLVLTGIAVDVLMRQPLLSAVIPLATVAVGVPGYLRARHAIQQAKREEDWYQGLRQGVVADTSLRTRPERFPWYWAIPALLILAVTVAAGVIRYPSLPDVLPMHYNADGVADRVAAKSVGSAFALVFAQAGITALILALLAFSLRAKPDLDAARPVRSARQHRWFTVRLAKAFLLLAACVNTSMLLSSWQSWNGDHTISVATLLVPTMLGVVIVLGFAVRTGQLGSRMRDDGSEAERPGVAQRDDDRYWRGGLIYVNRKDPAVLVPKRFGIGWTLNFGNPKTLWWALPIVALIVLVRLLSGS